MKYLIILAILCMPAIAGAGDDLSLPEPGAPIIVDSGGEYRGNLSANPYLPDSTSNPYGVYGSPYSPDSINNPYGLGSPYDVNSPTNPYGEGIKIIEID